MKHSLVKFVAAVIGGPLFALGATYLGCVGGDPLFGIMCGHNVGGPFVLLCFALWIAVALIPFKRKPKK